MFGYIVWFCVRSGVFRDSVQKVSFAINSVRFILCFIISTVLIFISIMCSCCVIILFAILLCKKEKFPDAETVLHRDGGSSKGFVCQSKEFCTCTSSFNLILSSHYMSAAVLCLCCQQFYDSHTIRTRALSYLITLLSFQMWCMG